MEGQIIPGKTVHEQKETFNMAIKSNRSLRTEEYNDYTEIQNKDSQEYGQPSRRINNSRSYHWELYILSRKQIMNESLKVFQLLWSANKSNDVLL